MFDNPRLLVVDDEDVVCQTCRRVFSPQGFQVEGSTDPREGLGLARQRDYAAILLDIKMPQMDGIQFLEELRKEDPDVPVIFITGHPSIPNAASAVRLNASDYITKPCCDVHLVEREPFIGGHAALLACKATDNCATCGVCLVPDLLSRTMVSPKISLLVRSTLVGLRGYPKSPPLPLGEGRGEGALVKREKLGSQIALRKPSP